MNKLLILLLSVLVLSCTNKDYFDPLDTSLPANILNYSGTPALPESRASLVFSDQGAWFGYGFPAEKHYYGGFSGPFLMTQENGVWISPSLSQLNLLIDDKIMDWQEFSISTTSFNSHLTQTFTSGALSISQTLFYPTSHSALINTIITNTGNREITIQPAWDGSIFLDGIVLEKKTNGITIYSDNTNAIGHIQVLKDSISGFNVTDSTYALRLDEFVLESSESKELLFSQSFIFPQYSWQEEQAKIKNLSENWQEDLRLRISEKEAQLQAVYDKMDAILGDSIYNSLAAKTLLTLQNNWRIAAGELKHSGLFPSYHYKWFHGFWAWDSWKHAAALAQYDTDLAKEQVLAMYDFETKEGFIPDCIFRDTSVEQHNYRDTKPPLSAWAVWEIYQEDGDSLFVADIYPKIVKQHTWWYENRDHDGDSLCEYGSTDGNLLPAKWESGMDNAVRFDNTKLLKNSNTAYSMDQESVDLNAYLFAEKEYLAKMAGVLGNKEDVAKFKIESALLKQKIQQQFYDDETGWFYDTSIDGNNLIRVMGCEGWIPLWANIATPEQAEAVKENMLNPNYFNTMVPLPTLNASQPQFKPNGGYWRGPVWLDQAYFGVQGLKNYGYNEEAEQLTYKLIHNAEGVMIPGKSIRENYNPLTGEGLEAENFSWSAAHYLLLLLN